jgi:DNA-binding XRE family transcriptional regulator
METEIPTAQVWPTPALIRAARGLLAIGQKTLAERAGCSRKTVVLIEHHQAEVMDHRRVAVVKKLAAYFERQGIEFLRPRGGKGAGIRMREP